MSQNNTNDRTAMMPYIEEINKVEGFDPTPFAVEFSDLNSGEKSKRLPVLIQIAWFRMKYPTGRIAVQVTPAKDCFVATAKIYPDYKDSPECFLAEATASRGYCADKPSVSPREWAQTAAVGIALRNAGFGLQFNMAGDEFEDVATDELGLGISPTNATSTQPNLNIEAQHTPVPAGTEEYTITEKVIDAPAELSYEDKVNAAMQIMCPIDKFSGKTLGEVLRLDPGAIKWVATKYSNDDKIKEAATLICEYALQQTKANG